MAKVKRKEVDPAILSYYHYDPETGIFTYAGGKRRRGKQAGTLARNGYRYIHYMHEKYFEHRLAWYFVHGYFPFVLDHINGNKSDNRICNLRECSHSENSRNQGINSKNTSGYRGVSFKAQRGRYEVSIRIGNGKRLFFGTYTTAEEAALVYNQKAQELHGEFASLNQFKTTK